MECFLQRFLQTWWTIRGFRRLLLLPSRFMWAMGWCRRSRFATTVHHHSSPLSKPSSVPLWLQFSDWNVMEKQVIFEYPWSWHGRLTEYEHHRELVDLRRHLMLKFSFSVFNALFGIFYNIADQQSRIGPCFQLWNRRGGTKKRTHPLRCRLTTWRMPDQTFSRHANSSIKRRQETSDFKHEITVTTFWE